MEGAPLAPLAVREETDSLLFVGSKRSQLGLEVREGAGGD